MCHLSKEKPQTSTPYSEVTESFCRVPSTYLSHSPESTRLVHRCRFRVRLDWKSFFLEFTQCKQNPFIVNILLNPSLCSYEPFNLPSNTAFAFFLGAALTRWSLPVQRNPWTYGDNVYFSLFTVTHVSILTSDTSSIFYNTPSADWIPMKSSCLWLTERSATLFSELPLR